MRITAHKGFNICISLWQDLFAPATDCFESTSWLGTESWVLVDHACWLGLQLLRDPGTSLPEAFVWLSLLCRDILEEPKEEELMEKLHKHPHLQLYR